MNAMTIEKYIGGTSASWGQQEHIASSKRPAGKEILEG